MRHTHTHTYTNSFTALSLALGLAAACGSEPATTDSDTATGTSSTGATDTTPTTGEPEKPCASPQFQDTVGPGTMVQCEGEVANSFFDFTKCAPLCNKDVHEPIDAVVFPGGGEVGACCTSTATPADQLAACESDCAHAACLEAIQRFQELIDDPATTADCNGLGACEGRVIESLTYYRDFVTGHFDTCVEKILADEPFDLGEPPCGPFAGCLQHGSLDLNCSVTQVHTDVVLDPVCEEALSQPPEPMRQAGPIIGGLVSYQGMGSDGLVELVGTYVQTAYHACGGGLCPLVLEQVDVRVADFQVAAFKVSSFQAHLTAAAHGTSDGEEATFAPGSLKIRVTADITVGKNTVPFEGFASNEGTATVVTSGGEFSLDNAVFSMGPLTFVTTIDPSPCQPM